MIDLAQIRVDGGTQARVSLDQRIITEYRDAFVVGVEFPPVVVYFDGSDHWLADGFHRYFGAKAAGLTSMHATRIEGSQRDAVLHSVKANATHGLRRTNADKQNAIKTLLTDEEWAQWSDGKIAAAAGVSDKTVAAARRAISGNSGDTTSRTVERGGKLYRQNTAKIGKVAARGHGLEHAAPTQGFELDNEAFRALFTLPPIQASASTAIAAPVVASAPKKITGDFEIDSILWFQSMVATGDQALIAKAMEAAKRVKTPVKELGKRYDEYLMCQPGAHPFAVMLSTMNFGDLESIAKTAVERAARRHEALSRFGSVDALFDETPAESACKDALRWLKQVEQKRGLHEFDADQADALFAACPTLVPHTLSDALHALGYGAALYCLRSATCRDAGDPQPEFQAHEYYAFRMLARIPPRETAEALAVLDYMEADRRMDCTETSAILRNLITGPNTDAIRRFSSAAAANDNAPPNERLRSAR